MRTLSLVAMRQQREHFLLALEHVKNIEEIEQSGLPVAVINEVAGSQLNFFHYEIDCVAQTMLLAVEFAASGASKSAMCRISTARARSAAAVIMGRRLP